ncbi:MAG: ACP S-malonyltransferase [Firmicutes bacterium]|nr:ACP S-malonyltransferase [Bacillota bacterium]
MSLAFLFPGQGAQYVGMGRLLAESDPQARHLFDRAARLLGPDWQQAVWEGPEELLTQTRYTQPALFVDEVAVAESLISHDVHPDFVSGHSIGEYAALCVAGTLSYDTALQLVALRGEAMQEALPPYAGGMAAIVGLPAEVIVSVCQDVSQSRGTVVVANVNAPDQIVISGEMAAVEAASRLLRERGARRVIPLKVSGPFHSPLMAPANARLQPALKEASFIDAHIPVVCNVDGVLRKEGEALRDALWEQVVRPVRFTDCLQTLYAQGVRDFVEVGPGKSLAGLVKKTLGSDVHVVSVEKPEEIEVFVREWSVA